MMTNYHLIQLFILNFSMIIEFFTFFHLINLCIQYCVTLFLCLEWQLPDWLHLCLHACPGHWALLLRVLPSSAEMLTNSLLLPAEGSASHDLISPFSGLSLTVNYGLQGCVHGCFELFCLLVSLICKLHGSIHWFLRHVCALSRESFV